MFHFTGFGKLKCVCHTIDPDSGFQWAFALSSEKVDSVIAYFLEVMAATGMPVQIKAGSTPACVSS